MKIGILLAGALLSAPFFASGAPAQTAAAPAPSAAPAASPAGSPPSSAAPPAPFMPAETGVTPPAAGESAPQNGQAPANPIPVVAPAPPKPKKLPPPPPPLETALSSDPEPTVQPNTFFATAKASERYGAIVDAGGWPTDIVALRPGAKGPAVATLRKRLAIEGDLDAAQRERTGVGRRSDGGGQTFPVAHRPAADGRRRGSDA